MNRFVITGSGRCGTRYLSTLLTAAGLPCGHEQVFNEHGAHPWPDLLQADSSWMAVPHLPLDVPTVLLVRHPLAVVRSWVEIGFFGHDADNPTHGPLRAFAPHVYAFATAADRALSMWVTLTSHALAHAEQIIRLERLDVSQLERLLQWADADAARAEAAYADTRPNNRHDDMRARVGITHQPTWEIHDRDLARRGRDLVALLGYDPERHPDG